MALLSGRAVQVGGVVELIRHSQGTREPGELHLPPGRRPSQRRCAGGHGGGGRTATAPRTPHPAPQTAPRTQRPAPQTPEPQTLNPIHESLKI
jgi:hypothetical protein